MDVKGQPIGEFAVRWYAELIIAFACSKIVHHILQDAVFWNSDGH